MAPPFDLIEEAKRLIRFNTVTTESNADCAVHVGSLLRKMGAGLVYQESRLGQTLFLNVAGLFGKGKHPLLLTSHLDTVDPGDSRLWTQAGGDPWKMKVRGDTVVGLGVADAKLDLLCKLTAVSRFKGSRFHRPLIVLGTFGEESGLRGAARFCQGDLPRPQMALVGEPSQLELVTRHKGLAVLELIFKAKGLYRPVETVWAYEFAFQGKASHSSTPDLGTNAITASLQFLQALKKKYGKVALLSWEGGSGHNVIPASAKLRVSLGDRPKAAFHPHSGRRGAASRLNAGWYPNLPWEDLLFSIETMRVLLAPLEKITDPAFEPSRMTWNITGLRETKEGWCVTLDLRTLPGQTIQRVVRQLESKLWKRLGPPGDSWQFRLERENPPLEMKKETPLVQAAVKALRAARLPVKTAAKTGCSEAGLYQKVGIPSVVFGPGRSRGNIHRPNESNNLRQLKGAIRFYEEFLKRTCF